MAKKVHPSYEFPLLLKKKIKNIPVDEFSKLPDEIVVSIVSLMTLEEAARTSVLSRRWRYLWTFTTGSLDFDNSFLRSLMVCRRVENSYQEKRNRFVRWVNGVLRFHRGLTINEFKVCFSLNEKHFKLDIENWISFSLRKKVKRLILDLASIKPFNFSVVRQYTLTAQFLCNYHLDSLTTLYLSSVQVTGEVVEYVLSNCPFLEVLSVTASASLVNLKPSGPLLNLKHLEISCCFYLKSLEISAINLLSFKYCGKKTRILLGDVPNIVEVSYSHEYACSLVSNSRLRPRYLRKVETLSLDLSLMHFQCIPKFRKFRNLRQLKLTVRGFGLETLLGYTSLLEPCPFLHTFAVKLIGLYGPAGEMKAQEVEYPHQFLSVFELRGFLGSAIDMEFALYVLTNAVSLHKIIIDTRCPHAEEMLWDSRDYRLKEWATARARELKTRIPPGVEFMLL